MGGAKCLSILHCYIFGLIWSNTFINDIYVSKTCFFITLGVAVFSLVLLFVCSYIRIDEEYTNESIKFSIFCYCVYIITTSVGFSLLGFILKSFYVFLITIGLGASYFFLLALTSFILNYKHKLTVGRVYYFPIIFLLALVVVIFLINLSPIIYYFDPINSVVITLIYAISIRTLWWYIKYYIGELFESDDLLYVDDDCKSHKKWLSCLFGFQMMDIFMKIVLIITIIILTIT